MKKETALRKKEQLKTKNYYSHLFKADYEQFTSELKVMEVDDINSKEVEDAIKKIGPNLIIDHGTSLVKNHIIDLAELALNLHWGLSPYYRGVNCTSQALLNWEINNIGLTIHKLAKKIDGGDILGQARLKIEPNDTVATITSRLTFEGTAIVIKAIDKLAAGKTLTFKPQNFNHGFLIRGLYWDQIIHNYVNKIDENLMMKMIAKPSRDPAPIIELT